MAVFLNEERKAQALYGAMKERYRSLSRRATAMPEAERPLVMTGRSTRGQFTIAGGRSYVAALIKDAGRTLRLGGQHVGRRPRRSISKRRSGARPTPTSGSTAAAGRACAAMLDDEPRYAAFKAYRQGQVWVYERRQTPSGGNDYWSRSVTHPDLVLADLVKIFHPALAGDHAFEWYMPCRRVVA